MTETRPDSPATEIQLARLAEQVRALDRSFEAEKTSSKEAIAAAFKAAETATTAALAAQKESAAKSEANAEKQLEMHNGLIRKMDVLVNNFPTKESVEDKLKGVDQKFIARDARLNSLDRAVARAYGVGAGAVALASVAIVVAQ